MRNRPGQRRPCWPQRLRRLPDRSFLLQGRRVLGARHLGLDLRHRHGGIDTTYEWTYEPFTSSLAHPPSGWCLTGTSVCARFFGGQTGGDRYALMWQWSGGGGSSNGYDDFDQIDANRTP